MTLNLKVVLPISLEDCALSKKVFAFTMFPAVAKFTDVLILICIFEISDPVSHVFTEFTHIYTTVTINNATLTLPQVVGKFTLVYIAVDIYEDPLPVLYTRLPLAFIFLLFFWNFVDTITIFEIFVPMT
jgi:hypothetical protein